MSSKQQMETIDIRQFKRSTNQTKQECETVLRYKPMYLKYVHRKTLDLEMLAVTGCGLAIRYVRTQLPCLVEAAVHSCPKALAYVDPTEQTLELCSHAIQRFPFCIQFARYHTEADALRAVSKEPMLLKYVKTQTERICLKAVELNGMSLAYVNEQTEDICLTAVKNNGMALLYVENQNHKICLSAVFQNGLALQFVKEPTDEIYVAAITKNPVAVRFVRYPSKDLIYIIKSLKK